MLQSVVSLPRFNEAGGCFKSTWLIAACDMKYDPSLKTILMVVLKTRRYNLIMDWETRVEIENRPGDWQLEADYQSILPVCPHLIIKFTSLPWSNHQVLRVYPFHGLPSGKTWGGTALLPPHHTMYIVKPRRGLNTIYPFIFVHGAGYVGRLLFQVPGCYNVIIIWWLSRTVELRIVLIICIL